MLPGLAAFFGDLRQYLVRSSSHSSQSTYFPAFSGVPDMLTISFLPGFFLLPSWRPLRHGHVVRQNRHANLGSAPLTPKQLPSRFQEVVSETG